MAVKVSWKWWLILVLAAVLLVACDSGSGSPAADGDDPADGDHSDGDGPDGDDQDGDEEEPGPEWVDVFPHVRLTGTATLTELFPWPREAEFGVGAIRDEREETAWIAETREELPRIYMDLWPLALRMPLLERIVLDKGDSTATVTFLLYDYCGGERLAERDLTSGELSLEGLRGGCIELLFTSNAARVRVEAIRLFADRRDFAPLEPEGPPAASQVAFRNFGVIEGFYGVPWSWSERRRLMTLMAHYGMDVFVYAPKHDPYHRDTWREPYSEAELGRFSELARFGESLGVRLLMGLSPFVDFDEDVDYPILRDKILAFLSLGIDGVMLLADDIEFNIDQPVESTLGAMHARMVNRLFAELRAEYPAVTMWFTPTVYSDERIEMFSDGPGYLREIAALHEDIEILWTGVNTSNLRMTPEEMVAVTGYTGRAPLIWDNFWANDGGDGFTGRLLTAPFSGRDGSLLAAVRGIAHNPSIQGAASRLGMATFGYYLIHPSSTDTDAARRHAAEQETLWRVGSGRALAEDSDSLRFMMEIWNGHSQKETRHDELAQRITAFTDALKEGRVIASAEVDWLLDIFARMAAIESELHHSNLAADLLDELAYPAKSVRYSGELGLNALLLWQAKRGVGDATAILEEARSAQRALSACRFIFNAGQLVGLLRAVSDWTPSPGPSPRPPQVPSPDFSGCRVQDTFQIPGGTRTRYYGLGSASYTGQGESNSVNLPHPGEYRTVGVSSAADGATGGFTVSVSSFSCGLPL